MVERDANGRYVKGHGCSDEIRRKMSKAKKGMHLSPDTEFKKGQRPWNWNGNSSTENKLLRATKEYKLWRASVFRRDDYTCQECGKSPSGKLCAHHIKSFIKYPHLRYQTWNGITLCADCHDAYHTGV